MPLATYLPSLLLRPKLLIYSETVHWTQVQLTEGSGYMVAIEFYGGGRQLDTETLLKALVRVIFDPSA